MTVPGRQTSLSLAGRDRDGAFLLHANVDDRQEGPGVPGHVHAAHLRLHHRHILLRHRGRSQPRKVGTYIHAVLLSYIYIGDADYFAIYLYLSPF
jgi:hypothetical protein